MPITTVTDGSNPANIPLPPLIELSDFLAAPLPLPTPLVEGVFDQGSKMSVVGGSKSYKSWLAPDLALAIGCGHPWFGIPTVKARVMFLNFEVHPAFFQRRLSAICSARGYPPDAGGLTVWNLRGHATAFEQLIPQIIKHVLKGNVAATFTDPIYKLYGPETDENSAAQVAKLMNSLDRVCEAGSGVVFTAHSPKGNQAAKEPIDRSSGSGVFGRDPDTILTLTPHREDDCLVVEFKFRNHPPREAFVLRWSYPVFSVDANLSPCDLRQPKNKQPKFPLSQVIELLKAMAPCLTKDLASECHRKFKMAKSTFHHAYKPRLSTFPGVEVDGDVWHYKSRA